MKTIKEADPEEFHGFISALRQALEPSLFEAICDSVMSVSEKELNEWGDEDEVTCMRLLKRDLLQ